ncbi:MAG: Na/Pi cotransporter family protein [Lachnospiraceae bacterium]|nr:Na/Pi cotransporter family protein [Lachnospiraceae bacterium]
MYIFNMISLLGGLAMFLYGMRTMSGSLKEGSSGALKIAMERVTNNPIKAFFLGLAVTAIIQSSTATIVITSGLVAAGVISLHQSLGIIIGANVGTTVTGQIIRLLDVNSDSVAWLEVFKPSTLAPVALIIGIILIMFCKFKNHENIGTIAIGFGVLFSGLLNMTAAVSVFSENGMLGSLFTNLGNNRILGYLIGAGVAFVLQSSSATIGILQAFSLSGGLTFKAVYVVIVGVYLGDCVTTAIVCSIGAKPDSKRVGIVNILYNLSKTLVVLVVVAILHGFGVLDGLWDKTITSGGIADTNTAFNLGCAILLMPLVSVFENMSRKIVHDEEVKPSKYSELIDGLNPVFFSTPALAFRSCYNALNTMLDLSIQGINKAIDLFTGYDTGVIDEINEEEDNIDMLTDGVDTYLVKLSSHVSSELHTSILDHYHKVVTEFERLGDRAVYIAENATALHKEGLKFSEEALNEIGVVRELMNEMLALSKQSFVSRDVDAARKIEPMEEVMSSMLNTLHDNHLDRLHEGKCTIHGGVIFLDLISNLERIADICSNIGVATLTRANPGIGNVAHSYITSLHEGVDEQYNEVYTSVHDKFFAKLEEVEKGEKA